LEEAGGDFEASVDAISARIVATDVTPPLFTMVIRRSDVEIEPYCVSPATGVATAVSAIIVAKVVI
jgi:hypothetical protein